MIAKALNYLLPMLFLSLPMQSAFGLPMAFSLSKSEVIKNHNFSGASIAVNGKVQKADGVVINVLGPRAKYIIWEKEKKFGMWSNSKSFLTPHIPSYQFVTTNYDEQNFNNFINKVNNVLRYSYPTITNKNLYSAVEAESASIAFHDIRQENKMLSLKTSDFLIQDSKFTAKIILPTDIISGTYAIKIYVLKNLKIIGRRTLYFNVKNDEKYQKLGNFSKEHSILYVLVSITITILVGFAANFLFYKKIRKT